MKQVLLKCLFLLAVMFTFASCATEGTAPEMPEQDNSNLIGIEEALNSADELFNQIYGSTRAGRKPSSVSRFGCSKTRNADGENLEGFYIVNYEEGGFSLLSADKRTPSKVFAISNEGSLQAEDTLENEGLGFYLNNILPSITSSGVIKPIDPTIPYEPFNPGWSYNKNHADPLLKGFMSKFHQLTPYNYYCNSGVPLFYSYYVGCVPLATGTVMGYYKWPANLDGYSFDWEAMHKSAGDLRWARLFRILGGAEYTNVRYGIVGSSNGTGALDTSIPFAFAKANYKGATFSAFNSTIVNNQLETLNPVICSGIMSSGNGSERDYGHVWVIDGGYTKGHLYFPEIEGEQPYRIYETYYHCVWGWKGKSNGYYLYVNSLGGDIKQGDEGYQEPAVKYENLNMIYGYKPNK